MKLRQLLVTVSMLEYDTFNYPEIVAPSVEYRASRLFMEHENEDIKAVLDMVCDRLGLPKGE